MPGRETPSGHLPSSTPPGGHRFCLVFGRSSRAGGKPPPGPPPRARPLVLGRRFCLVLGHRGRAGGGNPPGHLLSSTPLGAGSQILSRAWPQQPRRGEGTPQDPPSSTPLGAGSQILSRAWTQQPCREPPPGPPPRARPLVLGHRFCIVLGHGSRAGKPPRTPPDPPVEHAPWCWVTDLFTFFQECPSGERLNH